MRRLVTREGFKERGSVVHSKREDQPIGFSSSERGPRLRLRRHFDRPELGARGQRAHVLRRVRTPGSRAAA